MKGTRLHKKEYHKKKCLWNQGFGISVRCVVDKNFKVKYYECEKCGSRWNESF